MSYQAVLSPETRTLLRRIAEEVPSPVAVLLAPDWRVVYANRSYRRLPMAGGGEVIGQKVADLFPGVPDAGGLAHLEKARRTGRTVFRRAVAIALLPDDPTTWWDASHHPLPDADGDFGAVLVVLREVTAEVLARQREEAAAAALARRAEQMRLAIDAAGMYFWDWDVTTGAIEWSEGLEATCGMAPGSFTGTLDAFRALVHPDDLPRVEAELARALSGEAAYDTEFRMLRADGGERWVLARGTVLRDAAGHPVRMVGIDLDLSERHRAEQRLASSEARLRSEVDARETLVREADHRIKNSLQMAAGLLRLQQNRTAEPEVVEALGRATSRVMAVAEAHRGLYESADLRTVDLCKVMRDLAAHIGSLSPSVSVHCASGGSVPIDAERGIPIGLIANELLTNAVRHAYPEGTGGTVEMWVEEQGCEIVLTISDTGRGLPEQPSAATSSGLGSALVRSLARQVGANVEVVTGPGQGTRVTLRLLGQVPRN